MYDNFLMNLTKEKTFKLYKKQKKYKMSVQQITILQNKMLNLCFIVLILTIFFGDIL